MKSRKQRIDSQKQQLLSQNLRSVKRVTTYLGTTFLMGAAGFSLNKEKAQADTVQVDQNNISSWNNTTTNNTNNTTSTASSEVSTVTTPQTVNVPTTYASNVQTFLQNIAGSAQQVAQQRGLYASLMIAQAALESGWGGSYLSTSAYNLFGVKWSGAGAYIELPTQEYYNGSYQTVYDKFQRYSSYAESLNGYANVITSRFPNSTRANAANYQIAAHNLRNGVYGTYATAPDYAEKLIRVIETYNLTAYDIGGQSQNTGNNVQSQPQPSAQETRPQATGTYTVKAGDNLYRIALAHSMSVQALKSLNNLSSDMIYVGQSLKVSGQPQTSNQNQNQTQSQPQPSAQETRPQTTGTYTVKAGDNLYRIALAHSMSVQALKSLNNLSSNMIYVGQSLKVSGQPQTSNQNQNQTQSQPRPSAQETRPQATGTYTVKAGDSLYRIAREHNMSLQALKTLNGLNSDLILPGQTLKTIGESKVTPNKTTPTTSNAQVTSNSGYVVKAGDTLWSIANTHKMTLATLKRLNNLSSDMIYVGQNLKVAASNENKVTQTSNNSAEYTVKAGDSLWKIASKNATTVDRIKALNSLSSDLIYIGQKLKLR